MTGENEMTVEEGRRRVALLLKHFFNRADTVAAKMEWGKPHPILGLDNLPGLLQAHVLGELSPQRGTARYENRFGAIKVQNGHFRIGSYTPDKDGNTRWLCLDFDGAGHSDPLQDPEAAVRLTQASFTSVGIPAYAEQSGSGKGWHLWVLFSEPTSAKLVRQLAHRLIPQNLPLARNGGVAMPRSNRGVEVFPKQDKPTTPKRLGNLVWLPWHHDVPPGANQFYREEGGRLVPYAPDEFDTVTLQQVTQALAALDQGASSQQPGTEGTCPATSGPRVVVDDRAIEEFLRRADKDDDTTHPPSTDWKARKEKALSVLDLDLVYGRWLTGSTSSDHWLQCQDPDSESGSNSRSGNVADGTGAALRGTFHSWRTNESFSIFDFMVRQGMAASFIDAAKQIAVWTGVPLPPGQARTPSQNAPSTGKPVIVCQQRQLEDVIWDTQVALNAANAGPVPVVYSHAGRAAHLASRDGKPEIDHLDDVGMYGILARLAEWVRRTEDGDIPVFPPRDVSHDLVKFPPQSLPSIDQVVTAPVFDATGRLVDQPGYDRESGVWFHRPQTLNIEPVSNSPTPEEIAKARSLLLDDLLTDFPFAAPSDRAHALAALILPFVRRMIDGPTPMHLIEAPVPGSGKTLVGEITCMVATGEKAEPTTLPRDGEEVRKKLLSLLLTSPQVVLLDNVTAGIDSADLASVITSERYKDRILGVSAMGCPLNRTVWLVSSNNPSMSIEIARRSARIRIDPAQERPWERKNFKHWPLKPWVALHRGEIVHALLTLVQAWIGQGCPSGTRTLGSFEVWAAVMGGILDVVGVPGFLGNTLELYEAVDGDGQEWREFTAAWWQEYGATPVTAKTLMDLALAHDLLGCVLGSKNERSQSIRLGKGLMGNRSRVFGDYRILTARVSHNQHMWQLAKVGDSSVSGQSEDGRQTPERGMLLPFQRDIPRDIPLRKPASNLVAGDVGDVGDVFPSFAYTQGTKNDIEPCDTSRTHIRGVERNIPHIPHIPQTQQNGGSNQGDVEGDVVSNPVQTSPDAHAFDLADLPDSDDEVES